jgi:hypothetical protein
MIQDNSSYVFVQNGPEVPKDEIENVNSPSCEIKIFWEDDLIKFFTCDPKQSFTIGESLDCNFHIPGIEKLTLISPVNNGVIVTEPNDNQTKLSLGEKSTVNILDFKFEISLTNSGKRIASKYNFNKESIFFMMLSLMVHGMFLAAVFFYMPALSASEDGEMSSEQRFLLQQYLAAAAEKELKQEEPNVVENNPVVSGGETGAKSKGNEGTMGNYSATSNKGYGIAGPQNNPDPHIARQNALKDAMEFGMIGLISSGAGGDPNSPTAPWGRDESLGNDLLSGNGNMWSPDIGEGFGSNGLGLSGIGEGSGGPGEGIGVGKNLGGLGNNLFHGFDSGRKLPGKYVPKNIVMRQGVTNASGRIPPEVIQRVIRQNFGRFRNCYEAGLRNNPNLAGRVAVKFVIGRDGSVSQASNGGSDLPDSGVVSCIVGAFRGLSFPQPENGIVTVGYSIQLNPN